MFRPVYGDACGPLVRCNRYRRMDDMSWHPKDIDFLVYDKIRWDREKLVPELLKPILDVLTHRGFGPT